MQLSTAQKNIVEKCNQGECLHVWQHPHDLSLASAPCSYSETESWLIRTVARGWRIENANIESLSSLLGRINILQKNQAFTSVELLTMVWDRFERSASQELAFEELNEPHSMEPDLFYEEDFTLLERACMDEERSRILQDRILLTYSLQHIDAYSITHPVNVRENHFLIYHGYNLLTKKAVTFFVERSDSQHFLLERFHHELKKYEFLNALPKVTFFSQRPKGRLDKVGQMMILPFLGYNLKKTLAEAREKTPQRGLSHNQAHHTTYNILKALTKLKKYNLFHGSLRPEHIHFDQDNDIRIYFDLRQLLKEEFPHSRIKDSNTSYHPPEVQEDGAILASSDPWSTCAIAYSLLTLQPFNYTQATQFIEAASSRSLREVADNTPAIQAACQSLCLFPDLENGDEQKALSLWSDFLRKGLNPNIEQRASIEELIASPLFQEDV